jgi:PUA domain protein
MKVSSRHHLRSDEVSALQDALADALGVDVDADSFERVEFADDDHELVLVDGEPMVWHVDSEARSASERSSGDGPRDGGDQPFLTVHGANEYPPTEHVVTVDAGAVSFVSDGADVMRPGITEADDDIEDGDLVVVAEETHGKVLAVGRALTDGDDMVGDSGKVVESLHHVGDDLYQFSV